jgi:hypothetical protein
MQVVRITNSHFEVDNSGSSHEVFKGGAFYPQTEASLRQVALGNGDLVDAPADPEKAVAAAEAAEAKAEKAADAAAAAREAADAAEAAAAGAVANSEQPAA